MSGTRAIASATALPFREAIAYFRGKTNTPTQHWTDVWRTAHARSFMVAGAASDALLNDFRTEITRALEQGTTLRDFRRSFNDIVARHGWEHTGTPGWRSRIIYETNLSMAYAAGRYAQMTEPDTLAAFPYWQYVHSRSRNPRKQHQQWDGLVLRADDPFWRTNYPPNGWRCGCRVRPLSGRGLERMGRDGPDASPPLPTRPWRNPRTGEVHQVVDGIDPGFDYNPGEAWQGPPQIPGDAVLRPPPRGWPPAPPTMPVAAPRAAVREIEPLVPPGQPVQAATDYAAWAERLIETRRSDGSVRVLGRLSTNAMDWLAERDAAPDSPAIGITSAQLLHLARDAKARAGRGLSLADIRRLPQIVAEPEAVLRERETGAILLVFRPAQQTGARAGKLVVQVGFDTVVQESGTRRRVRINAVKTGTLVDEGTLRSPGIYERIEGSV